MRGSIALALWSRSQSSCARVTSLKTVYIGLWCIAAPIHAVVFWARQVGSKRVTACVCGDRLWITLSWVTPEATEAHH